MSNNKGSDQPKQNHRGEVAGQKGRTHRRQKNQNGSGNLSSKAKG